MAKRIHLKTLRAWAYRSAVGEVGRLQKQADREIRAAQGELEGRQGALEGRQGDQGTLRTSGTPKKPEGL